MRMMKKVLGTVTVLALSASLLAGCEIGRAHV